jgi:hypothetical protein
VPREVVLGHIGLTYAAGVPSLCRGHVEVSPVRARHVSGRRPSGRRPPPHGTSLSAESNRMGDGFVPDA